MKATVARALALFMQMTGRIQGLRRAGPPQAVKIVFSFLGGVVSTILARLLNTKCKRRAARRAAAKNKAGDDDGDDGDVDVDGDGDGKSHLLPVIKRQGGPHAT